MAKRAAEVWFVYVLRCADGSLYTGITKDVTRTIQQHNDGTASRYTGSRRPVKLVYQESTTEHRLALKREAAIKRLTRKQKLALVRGALRDGQDQPPEAGRCSSALFRQLEDARQIVAPFMPGRLFPGRGSSQIESFCGMSQNTLEQMRQSQGVTRHSRGRRRSSFPPESGRIRWGGGRP